VIQYVTEAGNVRGYHPDFLLERVGGGKELHEIKGGHLLKNPDTIRKHEAAKNRYKKRGMNFVVVTK
jgi:TnsA endonuclease N terminal